MDAFQKVKAEILSSPRILAHCEETKISADGLGAVLLQLHNTGWCPVAFASRTLQSCQGLRISMCEIFESAISSPHQHYCGRKNTLSNLTEPYIATIISSCLQRLL